MVSNAFEARRSVASSRTRRASPSTIRCISPASVVMTQRPSAARFRLFLAVSFEAIYSADSDQTANNGMTCGAPSGCTVASQNQPPFVSRSSKSSHRTGRELPTSPAAAVPFPSRDIASPAGLWCIIRISPILSYAFVPRGYTFICRRLGGEDKYGVQRHELRHDHFPHGDLPFPPPWTKRICFYMDSSSVGRMSSCSTTDLSRSLTMPHRVRLDPRSPAGRSEERRVGK